MEVSLKLVGISALLVTAGVAAALSSESGSALHTLGVGMAGGVICAAAIGVAANYYRSAEQKQRRILLWAAFALVSAVLLCFGAVIVYAASVSEDLRAVMPWLVVTLPPVYLLWYLRGLLAENRGE